MFRNTKPLPQSWAGVCVSLRWWNCSRRVDWKRKPILRTKRLWKNNWAVASTAEYKRLRGLAKQIEEFNHPPFTVARNGTKVSKEKVTDVLNYIVEDAKKDFTITRFKGLGEMNAEQLWDT